MWLVWTFKNLDYDRQAVWRPFYVFVKLYFNKSRLKQSRCWLPLQASWQSCLGPGRDLRWAPPSRPDLSFSLALPLLTSLTEIKCVISLWSILLRLSDRAASPPASLSLYLSLFSLTGSLTLSLRCGAAGPSRITLSVTWLQLDLSLSHPYWWSYQTQLFLSKLTCCVRLLYKLMDVNIRAGLLRYVTRLVNVGCAGSYLALRWQFQLHRHHLFLNICLENL